MSYNYFSVFKKSYLVILKRPKIKKALTGLF